MRFCNHAEALSQQRDGAKEKSATELSENGPH